MAVELKALYEEICPQYDVKLHTKSYFGKMIGWIHMVEDVDFVPSLHGDELVLNSGLNYTSEEWLKRYIETLNQAKAKGLIIALRNGHTFPQKIIDYCNQIGFPLFSASWNSPYIDIMRIFSVILLRNEQKETNRITALKNAIHYPQNKEHYYDCFEEAGFVKEMAYVVALLSCHAYDRGDSNERLQQIEETLHHQIKRSIIYEEARNLVIMAAGYKKSEIVSIFRKICHRDGNVYVGIGSQVNYMKEIYKSYEYACTAHRLTKTAIPKNILDYEELGVYKVLADVKEAEVYSAFVQETLGKLFTHDKKNGTNFVEILKAYFENECSIIASSQILYCHKNTLTYKLNKIKEILGYDILSNENRTKIMLAFYIMELGEEYFLL